MHMSRLSLAHYGMDDAVGVEFVSFHRRHSTGLRNNLTESQPLKSDYQADVNAVGAIDTVPTILGLVCRTTGMGFAAVARVTEDR